jgi:hypothetical protein
MLLKMASIVKEIRIVLDEFPPKKVLFPDFSTVRVLQFCISWYSGKSRRYTKIWARQVPNDIFC